MFYSFKRLIFIFCSNCLLLALFFLHLIWLSFYLDACCLSTIHHTLILLTSLMFSKLLMRVLFVIGETTATLCPLFMSLLVVFALLSFFVWSNFRYTIWIVTVRIWITIVFFTIYMITMVLSINRWLLLVNILGTSRLLLDSLFFKLLLIRSVLFFFGLVIINYFNRSVIRRFFLLGLQIKLNIFLWLTSFKYWSPQATITDDTIFIINMPMFSLTLSFKVFFFRNAPNHIVAFQFNNYRIITENFVWLCKFDELASFPFYVHSCILNNWEIVLMLAFYEYHVIDYISRHFIFESHEFLVLHMLCFNNFFVIYFI